MASTEPIPDYAFTIARRLKERELSEEQIQHKLVADGLTAEQALKVVQVISKEAKVKPRNFIGKVQRAYAARSLVYGFVSLMISVAIIQIFSAQGVTAWSCAMFFLVTGLMGLMHALVTFINSWI
jgi:hypothetical protein